MACSFLVVATFCKVLLLVNLTLQPAAAKSLSLKFEPKEEKDVPVEIDRPLPPSSVHIRVEKLDPMSENEWIIYTLTDDQGKTQEVFGMKLKKDRETILSKKMFCRLWKAAAIDHVVTGDDDSENGARAIEVQPAEEQVQTSTRVGLSLMFKYLISPKALQF